MKTKIRGLQVTSKKFFLWGSIEKPITYHQEGLSLTIDSNKGSFIITEKMLEEIIEKQEKK